MSQVPTPPPIPAEKLAYFTPIQYDTGSVWRDGGVLIVHKSATLPDRCIKCNADANEYRLRRKLSWHPPAYYILIFFPGLLIYIIVALCIRKTATVHIGLCETHRRRRRNAILIAWFLVLGSFVLFFAAAAMEEGWIAIVGAVSLLAGALYGVLGVPGISPKQITADYSWLKGCGSAYLDTFPQMPAR